MSDAPDCPACDQPLSRTDDGKHFKMAKKPYSHWRHFLECLRQLWVEDECLGEAPLIELLCRDNGWGLPLGDAVYTVTEKGVKYEIRRAK